MKILSDNDSVVNFHTDEGNYGITLWAQKAGDGVRLRSKTTYVGTEMNEQQKKAAEWADKVASKLGFDPSKKETKAH